MMPRRKISGIVFVRDLMKKLSLVFILLSSTPLFCADDWIQFRGPNSSGVSDHKNLPAEFGPKKNRVCETDSFFLAVNKNTGKEIWRVERPEFTRGFSTPVIWTPPGGKPQALVAGSYQLTAYSVETGKAIWWVGGLTWQLKPTPVLGTDVIYIQNWAGGSDTGQQENLPPFEDMLKRLDADHDGKLSKQEIQDPKILNIWREVDLDDDGVIDARDWKFYRSRRSAQNGLIAIRLGGQGDMTDKSVLWRYEKALPNVPSPLLYEGV